MCHLHHVKCVLKFPSYAILVLSGSLFEVFFNGEVYIDVGVIIPTWQSKDTSEAIAYTWRNINP